jgi:hypothetical protein
MGEFDDDAEHLENLIKSYDFKNYSNFQKNLVYEFCSKKFKSYDSKASSVIFFEDISVEKIDLNKSTETVVGTEISENITPSMVELADSVITQTSRSESESISVQGNSETSSDSEKSLPEKYFIILKNIYSHLYNINTEEILTILNQALSDKETLQNQNKNLKKLQSRFEKI